MENQETTATNVKVKSRKSENYTNAEDLILIAAWEHTTEDSVIGTDQARCQYWTRVWKEYMKNVESYPTRSEKSVQNRFSTIRTKCLKFSGIVQSIENANPSGMTEQDKLNAAIATWATKEKYKGGFKLLQCYHVLKNSPKWFTEVLNPFASKNVPASGSTNHVEDIGAFGHVEMERPIGRKAEKENSKKRKFKQEDSADSTSVTLLRESQNFMQKLHDEKMKAVEAERNNMETLMDLKREKLKQGLMKVDMSRLTEVQRKYMEKKQLQVLEKEFGKDL